ncbi:MAG: hypothetical protein IFK92_10875 [Acidobacteria bacterium]|nr:hypothetical protein [Candidatus Sulfomarinibacter kjeldsenii]
MPENPNRTRRESRGARVDPVFAGCRFGIEIEAVDRGPGIEDSEAAMRDNFSSGGTLGLGLPGVKRLMDEFSLESAPGKGTRVTAVKWI